MVRTCGDFSLTSIIGGDGADQEKSTDAAKEGAVDVDASRQNRVKKQAEEEADEPFRMILVLQPQ